MLINNKGLAMPLVLMTLLVLSILGVSLLQYSITDNKQVAMDKKQMQAFYIARSGADAVAQYILDNPKQAATLINAGKSDSEDLGEGAFNVLVYGDPGREVLIKSTGTVDGVSQEATLSIDRSNLFDAAIAADNIFISGNAARINGNVVYKYRISDNIGSAVIPSPYTVTQNRYLLFPPADFPSDFGLPLISGDGSIEFFGQNKQAANITVDSRGTLISMNNKNHELNVPLGSSNNPKDRILIVYNFELTGGEVTLHGSGRLLLFVNSFRGGGNFRIAPGSNATIVVFVKAGGSFNMNGTPEFRGIIYAPDALVNLSGNSSFTGSIVADTFTGGGNITLTYAGLNTSNLPIPLYRRGVWR